MINETRGYFEIGIYSAKTPLNVGTLWRSAFQLGAAGIFTIGRRFGNQASDTTAAYRHIPYREYERFNDFIAHKPKKALIVGVEMGGEDIRSFDHPESAIYLLGAEDHGLSQKMLDNCHMVVSLPSVRQNANSYNVAVAGSIIMFDRFIKRGASNEVQ